MRRKLVTPVAALLLLLLTGSIAALAYDTSRRDLIADGVTVGAVDLGGERVPAARAKLRRELVVPLRRRPVEVRVGRRSFYLVPAQAGLRLDLDGIVADALRRSREGNFVTRAVRDLFGGGVDAELRPRVAYSRRAVRRFAERVKRAGDRQPSDATVRLARGRLRRVRERPGLAVRVGALADAIGLELLRPESNHVVAAPAAKTPARVTLAELPRKYRNLLVVDRDRFTLRLYRRLRLVESYRIAVGQVGLETPAGLYRIRAKAVNPPWQVPNKPWAGELAGQTIPPGSPDNPIKARWLEFHDGAGIHGTDEVSSLGRRASHGCIRMRIREVIELYRRVPVRTPVYIA